MKNVALIEQILFEDASKKIFSTRWSKDDPSRNSHDTVHFTTLNFSVKKPGKSQDVFVKISDGESFFLGCNSIGKVSQLYHKLFENGNFISRIEIVFKKEWLKNYYKFLDIITFNNVQKHILEKKRKAALQELSTISAREFVSRPIINCSICCKRFQILSEYMYHRFLCHSMSSKEMGPFQLKLMIRVIMILYFLLNFISFSYLGMCRKKSISFDSRLYHLFKKIYKPYSVHFTSRLSCSER